MELIEKLVCFFGPEMRQADTLEIYNSFIRCNPQQISSAEMSDCLNVISILKKKYDIASKIQVM